jgi:hypothetical protein
VRKWQSADAVKVAVNATGIVLAIVAGLSVSAAAGLVVLGTSIPVAFLLAAQRRSEAEASCGRGCVIPGPAVSYLGWSGSVKTFSFSAETYAGCFAQSNARNLVNVSADLRQALEHLEHLERLALVVPIAAGEPRLAQAPRGATERPSAEPVLEWIARIESFKGSVARRNAVERALQEIQEPHARQQLVLAASRIEVAAVLDKVDGLASLAAKKRHLGKAMADIRADNISDELQAAELQELARRLQSLR